MADETEPSTDESTTATDESTTPPEEATTAVEESASPAKVTKTKANKSAGTSSTKPAGTDAPVVKKKVVSKRITPKGGGQAGATSSKAHAPGGHDAPESSRYTPPSAKYADMPSPTWVPVLMFVLLGLGGLVIVLNYARVFGEPDNWRLVIGLGAILGGIITATQYH